ncbi:c-type cytochrome [bacterium]|nr:c-type cytochrome [bacterium]
MTRLTFLLTLLLAVLLVLLACETKKEAPPENLTNPPAAVINEAALAAFAPLPQSFDDADHPVTHAKVDLGRMLYHDARFSKAQDISCGSCHDLMNYGVDNKPTSPGHKGKLGARNSPTVYNSAGQFAQFWDGREPNVEAQALGPVMNPVEMAMPDEKRVLAVIKSMPEYVAAFEKAFPGEKNPVTFENFGKAIGAFERGLVTPSRWDRYLRGDKTALTEAEINGFNKFAEAGCTACHRGELIGGHIYQKAGAVKPWPNADDLGRYAITASEADKFVFKVPTLRNIAKTAPYFHDGKTMTLMGAINTMAEYQLGRALMPDEVSAIEAWLTSLTGDIPADYIGGHTLPPSTAKTPKPDPA